MARALERVTGTHTRRPARDPDPDLLLGRYRLESPIGDGATSTVWRARDERLDRPVAVKVLHDDLVADAAARDRLQREARSVARLNHPNVVGVHDVSITRRRAAVVLEYVPGRSLRDQLRNGTPIPLPEAARIGAAVASALAAAHAIGVVHRDVKPANVLLGDDGRPRLADFGIATALEGTSTEADGVVGTIRYLAPERLRGDRPTPASDVWSLAVVLHEMLTGRPPFLGTTPLELLEAATAGPPSLPGVDTGAASLVRAALDPDPSRRPSAAEVAGRLASAAAGPADRPLTGGVAAGGRPSTEDSASASRRVVASAVAGARSLATPPPLGRDAPDLATPPVGRDTRDLTTLIGPTPIVQRTAAPSLAARWRLPPIAAIAAAIALPLLVLALAFGPLRETSVPMNGTASGPSLPAGTPPAAAATLPLVSPSPAAAPASPQPHRDRGKGHGHGGGGDGSGGGSGGGDSGG